MKLGRRATRETSARCLPTNLATGEGATTRAVGIERQASLVNHQLSGSSLSFTGEDTTTRGRLVDTARRPERGKDDSTRGRVGLELEKLVGSLGETPRSKVGAGNGDRRPAGGRGARSNDEPSVTRGDPATSRAVVADASRDHG